MKDFRGRTPLHLASLEGHTNVVRILLAHGADVNAENKNGALPIRLARFRGHTEIVEILTKAAKEQADQ